MTGSLERFLRLGPTLACAPNDPSHVWPPPPGGHVLPTVGAICRCGMMAWTGAWTVPGPEIPYVSVKDFRDFWRRGSMTNVPGLGGPRRSWHLDNLTEQATPTCHRQFDPHEPRLRCLEPRGHAGPCSTRNSTHPVQCRCEACLSIFPPFRSDPGSTAGPFTHHIAEDAQADLRDRPHPYAGLPAPTLARPCLTCGRPLLHPVHNTPEHARRDVRIAEDKARQAAQRFRPDERDIPHPYQPPRYIGGPDDPCVRCDRPAAHIIHNAALKRFRRYARPHPYLANSLDARDRAERRCVTCGQREFALIHHQP